MTNSYIQLNTSIPPYNSGNIVVHVAPTNIGASVTIRDIGGDPAYFYDNSYSIIVSTTTGSFTDGTSLMTISIPYGSMTLTAVSSNRWAPVFNEVLTAYSLQTISSLYVSTNMYSYNYMNTISTTVYGNISTNMEIEVNGQLMLGTSTTLTVSTMSNTFLNLSATSSYVSSIAFLSVMSNLASISDPYISTTTLDTVFKNLGTSYTYVSTAQMSKDIGVLSTLYISSLNQFNRQLTAPNGLIYNSNGVMTNNSSITVNKWYGVTTMTYPTILPYMLQIVDTVYLYDSLYILTPTILYSYDYNSSRTATPLYSIFTNAVAITTNGSKFYVCDVNIVWILTVSYSPPIGFSITNPSAIYFEGQSSNLYVYANSVGNQIGSIYKYDADGIYDKSIGKFLNSGDRCVGFALGEITLSTTAKLQVIYIASQTQIYVYALRGNGLYEVYNYTLYGPLSNGDLTITKYNNFEVPYTTNIARTNSIRSLKYHSNTVYFIDGNRLRTLNFSQLSVNVTGVVGMIDGFAVTTRAGSGLAGTTDGSGTAASMDYSLNGSLSLQILSGAVSNIFTYDNINQRFRNISATYAVTTQYIFQVIGAPPLKIQDMTYDINGNLYILTPFTLQQYNLTTQTSTPAFRQFYYISTMNLTYDGANMLYIYDFLPSVSKVNVWGVDINTLNQTLILSINSVSFAASLYISSLYYFDSSNVLKGVNVKTGSAMTVPTLTSPRTVKSLVVTSTNMYVCDISGSIRIYNTALTPALLNSTLTVAATMDGYFDGLNVSYAFSRSVMMKLETTGLDTTGTVYFTDTHTVRKLMYNSTTNRGQVVTIAGNGTAGALDGDGDLATLTVTRDSIAVYKGTIYITDRVNNTLRVITPLSGNDRLYTTFVSSGTTVVNGYTISNYIGLNTGMSLTSDLRLKESIIDLTSSLEKISRLEGVYYKKIGDDKQRIGCIAQDVAIEYPEVVDVQTNGTLSIYYDQLTAPLVESIKELRKRVLSLESRAISKNMGL